MTSPLGLIILTMYRGNKAQNTMGFYITFSFIGRYDMKQHILVIVMLLWTVATALWAADILPNEGFESAVPPTGWVGSGFSQSNTSVHGGTYAAKCTGTTAHYLTTPLLSSPLSISFWGRRTSTTSSITVAYSSTQNGTFTTISTQTLPSVYTQYMFDLSGLTNVYVRLTNGGTGAGDRYIDDVLVTNRNDLTLTLSSASPAVAAADLMQSTTKNPLTRFVIARNNVLGVVNVTKVVYATSANTTTNTDFNHIQLWSNTTDALSSATLISTTATGTGRTFNNVTAALANNASTYFWITAEVSNNPTNNRAITVNGTLTITYSAGTQSGSASAAGTQTVKNTAATDDYRTKAAGNWSDYTTVWERYNGSAWAAATASPSSANGIVNVTHTVAVDTDTSIDQLGVATSGTVNVNSGKMLNIVDGSAMDVTFGGGTLHVYGTLKLNQGAAIWSSATQLFFENGGKYQHNYTTSEGTVPTAAWNAGSVCEFIGYTTNATTPAGTNQTFGSVWWNCTSQGNITINITNADVKTLTGNFIMKSTGSGTGKVTFAISTSNTKTIAGNFEIQGGTIDMTTGGATIGITVGGDFIMSGGAITESGTSVGNGFYFTSAGVHNFTKTAGTMSEHINFEVGSGATLDMGTSTITGLGTFTVSSGATLVMAAAGGLDGNVASTGTKTLNPAANYTFNGTVAQVTGASFPATVNNLVINNSAGITLTNAVVVDGILTQTAGSITGTQAVDGYSSPAINYLAFPETGNNIADWSVNMAIPVLVPLYVNRRWTISGSYTGSKTITFYWNSTDEGSMNWTGKIPAVWNGAIKYSQLAYDVSSAPRFVTVSIPNILTKGDYVVGQEVTTLPIELSSFTVTQNSEYFVQLHWVTQSETGVSGFYVYRNSAQDLSGAFIVSPFIAATNTSAETTYSYIDSEATPGTWYYWLQNLDMDGDYSFYGPISINLSNNDGENPIPVIPVLTSLQSIYPNPFNPLTTISYGLAKAENVNIRIFNLKGQIVRNMVSESKAAGSYRLQWNGTDDNGQALSSGVYYITMTAGKYTKTQKAILLK